MIFDLKLLTALIFISLSIATIFSFKSRTSIITALISIHLVLILFLSVTITNYNSFKEVVLTLIAYLMALLFLISNYNDLEIDRKSLKIKASWTKLIAPTIISIVIFFATLFLATYSIKSLSKIRMTKIEELTQNNSAQIFDIEERKKNRLKKKLHDNFLLTRSSDVILIIVCATSAILLLQRKKT